MTHPAVIAGRFERIVSAGAGAVGQVYRARDRVVGDEVAVKVPRALDPDTAQALRDEFRLRAEVDHPNLAMVRGLFEHDGQPVLAQEWARGEPLTTWIATRPPEERTRALRDAAIQLLGALGALHAAEVVHGDLKPEHVLVGPDGRLVLIDLDAGRCAWMDRFGHTDAFLSGTRGYLAPELFRGEPIGPATDLYAAGAVLHEALLGRLPGTAGADLPAGDMATLLHGLLSEDPARRLAAVARYAGVPTWQPGVLLGRQDELATLTAAADQAHARMRVVEVVGPAGIGKTSLVRSFLLDRATAGELVLHSRCHPAAAVPYVAIDGWLDTVAARLAPLDPARRARLLGALPAALPRLRGLVDAPSAWMNATDQEVEAAFVDVIAELARARRLHLWIDDAQWADSESAPLLRALRRHNPPGVSLYVTSRTAGVAPEPDVRLDLRGLPGHAVEALIRRQHPTASADHLTRLAHATEGNPLLITQLASEPLGAGELSEALTRRVQRAGPTVGRLLLLTSLAALPLDAGDAHAMIGAGWEASLAAARSLGLLALSRDEGEVRLVPVHDRVREAAVALVDAATCQALHAELGERFAAQAHAPAWVLAHHAQGAGDRPATSRHALRAADEAREQRAWGTAARWYQAALAAGVADDAVRAALAECCTRGGELEAAHQAWMALATTPGPLQTEARIHAASVVFAQGDLELGKAVLRPVMEAVGMPWPRTTIGWVVGTVWWMARLAWWERTGRRRAVATDAHHLRLRVAYAITGGLGTADGLNAVVFGARHRFEAARYGDPVERAQGEALRVSWAGAMSQQPALIDRLEAEVVQRLAHEPDASTRGLLSWATGYGRFLGGEMGRAREWLDRSIREWEDARESGWERDHAARHVSWTSRYLGDFGRMTTSAIECMDRGRATGNRVHEREVRAGLASYRALTEDDPDRASAEIDAALGGLGIAPWFGLRYVATHGRMFVGLYRRDPAEAAAAADDLWGITWLTRQMLHTRVETHLAWLGAASFRDAAEVRRAARRLRRSLRGWTARWAVAAVAASDATVAWADEDPEAPRRYDDVADAFAAIGMAAHADAARLHAATLRGDHDGAHALHQALRDRGLVDPTRWLPIAVPGPAAFSGSTG